MDLIIAIIVSFICIIISLTKGYFIGYPLLFSLIIFTLVLWRRGFTLKALISLAIHSSQKSFSVISILLLIGAVTGVWMAAGTVPALVYYGIQLLNPRYFILSAFILTSMVSVLLGTSFGTVSTIGIALMIMARESDANPHIVAGAIIAGAYFGDCVSRMLHERASPMSSSANLVATITQTKLYINLKNMMITGWLPFLAASFVYLVLSISNPIAVTDNILLTEIPKVFNLNLFGLLPGFIILLLSLLQIEVKITLFFSIITSLIIGIFLQKYSLTQLLNYAVYGFDLGIASPLAPILKGGGIIAMLKVSIVVIISTALSGMIAGTRVLESVEVFLEKSKSRSRLFLGTIVVGTAAAAFGCTQTIAILLTQQLVQESYHKKLDNYQLALDLENTVVVISPLIPWNIAGLVPVTILMTDWKFIPYTFYLYFLPIFSWIQFKRISLKRKVLL
ncbi:Na+/H+ antiporter NhaC family protein [Gloeocapsopsis crepidinum LEGE 06123]|uniref:Na+/H+ antiporter NhaC family protein n=1 Tax=Gloeocapsopsis crepidinum LEGE 06123 TaxID=588587 RepID=A0ABR9US54_9CHRO|nr:Na+/H+ antiporter NhaC family protein [Gloeocapsopsis crepidinum]MBE9191102.1 Na+/H+ antiporter NhaC family protein [Gloeocapsopsis crepidinum LEGE 06123]